MTSETGCHISTDLCRQSRPTRVPSRQGQDNDSISSGDEEDDEFFDALAELDDLHFGGEPHLSEAIKTAANLSRSPLEPIYCDSPVLFEDTWLEKNHAQVKRLAFDETKLAAIIKTTKHLHVWDISERRASDE